MRSLWEEGLDESCGGALLEDVMGDVGDVGGVDLEIIRKERGLLVMRSLAAVSVAKVVRNAFLMVRVAGWYWMRSV